MATNPADPVLSATSASADPLGLPPAKMLKSMQNIWRCSMASDVMSDDPQTIVTLQSKEEDEPCFVTIHKELLCFYSPYHDRLLNSGFAEGRIPRTEPLHIDAYKVVLEAFFKWLYTGKLPTLFPEDSSADELRSWYFQLTMLYVLADWMNCTALQRAIMSALVSLKPTILPSFEAIGALSDSSLESSQLYRYFADRYAEHWDGLSDGHCDIDSDDSMPQNFSHRVLLRRLRKDHHHDDSDRYIGYDCICCHHPCRYHNHDDDVERRNTCGWSDAEFEEALYKIRNKISLENKRQREDEDETEDASIANAKRIKT